MTNLSVQSINIYMSFTMNSTSHHMCVIKVWIFIYDNNIHSSSIVISNLVSNTGCSYGFIMERGVRLRYKYLFTLLLCQMACAMMTELYVHLVEVITHKMADKLLSYFKTE